MRQVLLVVGAALSAEGRLQTALLETTPCAEYAVGKQEHGVKCPRTKPTFNGGLQDCAGTNISDSGCIAANCCQAEDCLSASVLVDAVPKGPDALGGDSGTLKCDANFVRRFPESKMTTCGEKTDADCTVAKCCNDISAACKGYQNTAYDTTPEWKDVIQGTDESMAATCKAPWAKPWAVYLGCLQVAQFHTGQEYKRLHERQLQVEYNKINKEAKGTNGDVGTNAMANALKIRLFAVECAKDAGNSPAGQYIEKKVTDLFTPPPKDDGSCASC
jgi:hypothetical protein